MNDYSYTDLLKMQEEAKRRVLDMQKRSKDYAESFASENKDGTSAETADENRDKPRSVSLPVGLRGNAEAAPEKKPAQTGKRSAPWNIFGKLSRDEKEKLFILSLCLLLTNEGCEDELLLALMYILT